VIYKRTVLPYSWRQLFCGNIGLYLARYAGRYEIVCGYPNVGYQMTVKRSIAVWYMLLFTFY
jgi:hypothetical protein